MRSRQIVFQLGKLDLHLAVAAVGPAGEDVEDQLRAVDDLQLSGLPDRAYLRGSQVLVENEEGSSGIHRVHDDFLEFAFPHQCFRVNRLQTLDNGVEHQHVARFGQLAQLFHRFFQLIFRFRPCAHEDCPLPGVPAVE